jgi:hypothetical protein
MALIIENGNQIPNANSYVSDVEYTDYATAKGLTVAATPELREVDLLAGIDYILSREPSLQGNRVSATQSMTYPRTGVYLHTFLLANDAIPTTLKNAQMEAAAYSTSGALLSNSVMSNTQKEKLDTLEVTYFKGGQKFNVNLQRVNAHLQPLMKDINKLVRT